MLQIEWKNGLRKVLQMAFNIMAPLNPTQFQLFVDEVVPILQDRGLVQEDYRRNIKKKLD